jgi:hypothetical protein
MGAGRCAGWRARALGAFAALSVALSLGGAPAAAHAPAAHPCAAHAPLAAPHEDAGDHGPLQGAHCCAAVIAHGATAGAAPPAARPARPRAAAHRPGRARAPPAPPPRAV